MSPIYPQFLEHLYFRDKLGFWGWLKRPYGNKTISKNQYKAFWYHGNKDAYAASGGLLYGSQMVYNILYHLYRIDRSLKKIK